MKTNNSLQVCYKEQPVGILALSKSGQVAFEYDENSYKGQCLSIIEDIKRKVSIAIPVSD